MNKNTALIIKGFLTCSLVIFLLMMISGVFKDYDQVKKQSTLDQLNLFRPTARMLDYLVDTVYSGKDWADAPVVSGVGGKIRDLERFKRYYEQVAEAMPYRADALGMAGFCYFHLGQTDKAIDYYQRAEDQNPHFFWYPYHLGLIYYKNNQLSPAIKAFRKALDLKPVATISAVKKSVRIYMPVVARISQEFNIQFYDELRNAFLNARALLILSHYHLGLEFRAKGQEELAVKSFLIAERMRKQNLSALPENPDTILKIY